MSWRASIVEAMASSGDPDRALGRSGFHRGDRGCSDAGWLTPLRMRQRMHRFPPVGIPARGTTGTPRAAPLRTRFRRSTGRPCESRGTSLRDWEGCSRVEVQPNRTITTTCQEWLSDGSIAPVNVRTRDEQDLHLVPRPGTAIPMRDPLLGDAAEASFQVGRRTLYRRCSTRSPWRTTWGSSSRWWWPSILPK
jgi:hypothetical protein